MARKSCVFSPSDDSSVLRGKKGLLVIVVGPMYQELGWGSAWTVPTSSVAYACVRGLPQGSRRVACLTNGCLTRYLWGHVCLGEYLILYLSLDFA